MFHRNFWKCDWDTRKARIICRSDIKPRCRVKRVKTFQLTQLLDEFCEFLKGSLTIVVKSPFMEGVKNTQRGGALKFAAKDSKTLTPPKNS